MTETAGNTCSSGSKCLICIGVIVCFLLLAGIGVGVYFGITLSTSECDIKHCSYCHKDECLECDNGWFGTTCKSKCGENCRESGCVKGTGICLDCLPGFYETACRRRCPDGCLIGSDQRKHCDRISGNCFECAQGFWGRRCTDKCRVGCHTCNQDTGECTSCAKGYNEPPRCDIICDNCKNDRCSAKGDSFTCDEGCKDGWTSDNCLDECSKRCKYGLCRINSTCFSCIDGFYGPNCQTPCEEGCSSLCAQDDGHCNLCKDGFYGQRCQQKCYATCPKCDKYNGFCKSCIDGYFGPGCLKRCSSRCTKFRCTFHGGDCTSCPVGFYGVDCLKSCPDTCENRKSTMSGSTAYSGSGPSCGRPVCRLLEVCIGVMTPMVIRSGWNN